MIDLIVVARIAMAYMLVIPIVAIMYPCAWQCDRKSCDEHDPSDMGAKVTHLEYLEIQIYHTKPYMQHSCK